MKTATKQQRKEIKAVKRLYKAATSNATKHVIMYDNEVQLSKSDAQNSDVKGVNYKVWFVGINALMYRNGKAFTGCKVAKGAKESNTLQFKKR